MKTLHILLCLLVCKICQNVDCNKVKAGKKTEKKLITKEIKKNVEKIKEFMNGTNKGRAFLRLSYTTDRYGPRPAGSEGLEKSIDVIKKHATNYSLDMREENVTVDYWKEISSTARLISQFRNKSLSIVAYGPSVSIKGKLLAPILLVNSFEELENKSDEALEKIVVYNQRCDNFTSCGQYRNDGASKAAKYGALASLTRSVTPYSFNNLITGPVTYTKEKKIPAASITIEDAAFIKRILERDPKAEIELDIKTETQPDKISRNLIIEIPGAELKNEILLSGTHTDSWHVDDGVSNNAVGCIVLYEAMRVIKYLDLKPKRTLRLALWTAGEQNAKGERQFFDEQKKKTDEQIKLIMKAEGGVFYINGLIIENGDKFRSPVQNILDTFFKRLNLTSKPSGESVSEWVSDPNIPRFQFSSDLRRYYGSYNSGGDTLDKVRPEDLDKAVTIWSTILYVLGSVNLE